MAQVKLLKGAAALSTLCMALSASAQVLIEDTAKPGNSGDLASGQTAATQSKREGTTPTTTRETTTPTQSGMSASGAQQSGTGQAAATQSKREGTTPTTSRESTTTTQSGMSAMGAQQSGTGQATTQYGAQPATQPQPSIRTNGSKLPPAEERSREATDAQSGVPSATMGQSGASTTGTTAAAQGMLSKADQKAVKDMAMANMAEVELGRMAQSKSSSDEVKAFAQQMIDDHGKALADVQTLAQAKGVTLPTELDAKHRREADRLDKLSGDAFDKAYAARAGVADHKAVHAALGKIRSNAKDADVRAAAETMRPVVQQHLTAARQLHDRVKSGKKDDAGGAKAE